MQIQQLASNDDELALAADFRGFPPDLLFGYWIRPDLLRQWWPRQAEVTPGVGGTYHFWWPEQNDHLRGQYTVFDPGKQLTCTWRWDHDAPETPTFTLAVTFAALPSDDGARLTLRQGAYPATAEGAAIRKGHLEGWTYFLAKLDTLAPADDWTRGADSQDV